MKIETIKFQATDETILTGILYNSETDTKKQLSQYMEWQQIA